MKLSIIIPMYNSEKYITRCIQSLEKNVCDDFEIIVVNDGSLDSSLELVTNLQKIYTNIKIININNSGVSHARNIGIENSSGEYICFVDSDDSITDNYFDVLFSCFDKTDLSFFNFRYIGKGKEISYYSDRIIYFSINEFNEEFINLYNYDLINSPTNKLYKSDIIKTFNIKFPENFSLGEDLIFNLEYLKRCKSFVYRPEILYNYHINDLSLTTSFRSDYLDIQEKILLEIKEYLQFIGWSKNNIENVIGHMYLSVCVSYLQDVFQNNSKSIYRKEVFQSVSSKISKCNKTREKTLQQQIILNILNLKSYYFISFFFVIKRLLLNVIKR